MPPAHADKLAELARARKKAGPVEVVHIAGVNHILVPAQTGEVEEYSQLKQKAISPRSSTAIVDVAARSRSRERNRLDSAEMRVGIPKESWLGRNARRRHPRWRRHARRKPACRSSSKPAPALAAGFTDAAYAAQGATIASRGDMLASDILLQVRAIPPANGLHAGQTVIGFADPLGLAAGHPRRRGHRRDAAVDGTDAAHHARAEHGRAVVDGDDRRLQGRAARRQPAAAHVPDADDRGRHRLSRRASSSSAPASPGCRRSRPHAGWARKVEAYDVRPAVKEQVQSLGARFVELPLESADAEDKGGYAKAQDESFYRRQREMMLKVVAGSDVVITTALIPGKRAPILVTDRDGRSDAAGIGRRRSRGRTRRQLRADAAGRDRPSTTA